MKKLITLIALVLVSACVLSFAACRSAADAGKDPEGSDTSNNPISTTTPQDTTTAYITTTTPQDTTTAAPETTTAPAETTVPEPQPVDPETIEWTSSNTTVYVKLENAWIRTNPDMVETSKLAVLHFGDSLECIATGADWCKVKYGSDTCYIADSCVTTDNISCNDFESTNETVYVTVDSAWLRRGPSTDTEQLSSTVKGEEFIRVAKNSTWSKITKDGKSYYFINNSLISTTKPE